jgi:hypothetical protein
LTDEHKKKLKDARAAARLLRENATKPADLPPGHDRNEAKKLAADVNAEQLDEMAQNSEAIDETKFRQKDNEIQRHIVRSGPQRGQIPVENPQPGFKYMRHPHISAFQTENARVAVRASLDEAKSWGWEFVDHDDPEDARYKGNDCAAGTNRRAVGDVMTMRITIENYKKMEAYYKEKQRRQGLVEERIAMIGSQAGIAAWGGDVSQNPELARRFGASAAQPITITSQFNEGDMRRGSIPGLPMGAR